MYKTCGVSPRVELGITLTGYLVLVVIVTVALLVSNSTWGYVFGALFLTLLVLIIPGVLARYASEVYFVVWIYSRLNHFDHWHIEASEDLQRLRIDMVRGEMSAGNGFV